MKARTLIFGAIALFLICGCGGVFVYLYNVGLKARSSVLRVTQQDAKLQAAAKVAQKTLPQFLTRLNHPEPGDKFAVKVRFKTTVGPEYLWLKDPKSSGGDFSATLDQSPIAFAAKKGDKLAFKKEEIFDYLIRRKDGSMAGGFTEIALDKNR